MRLLEAHFLPKGGSVEVLLSLACSGTGGSATVSPVVRVASGSTEWDRELESGSCGSRDVDMVVSGI